MAPVENGESLVVDTDEPISCLSFSDILSSPPGTISVASVSSRRMQRISVSCLSFHPKSHRSSHPLLSTPEVYICGSCSLETGLRTASEYLPFSICTLVVVRLSLPSNMNVEENSMPSISISLSHVCIPEPSKPSVPHALCVVDCPCMLPLIRVASVCALFFLSTRWAFLP